MKESIIIRNFGPIKDVVIDNICPFTVFIGESGSGKSTIMKVLVLFRWIHKMVNIRSYLKYSDIVQSPFKFDFQEYLINNGLTKFVKPNTDIIYQKGNFTIHYKSALRASKIVPQDELSLDKMCWIADQRGVISDALAGKKIEMNFYLNETYEDFRISNEIVQELKFNFLNVKYVFKRGPGSFKHYIEGLDGSFDVKLEDASSGMQMITPLSVIIEYFSQYYDLNSNFNKIILGYMSQNDSLKYFRPQQNIGDIKNKNVHIHIEEPELSLDPESQRGLINSIINRCFVESKNDMSIMLTTHSPYIINHLNLLVKAYDKDKLVEGANLKYDNLAVYEVGDGKINDLKIQNKHLIYTNPLSDTINNIYDDYNKL